MSRDCNYCAIFSALHNAHCLNFKVNAQFGNVYGSKEH